MIVRPGIALLLPFLLGWTNPPPVAADERALTARLMSLTYTAPVDPHLVHAHATKMRWSSARHSRGFDPTDPSHSLAEEEDESRRPTLCRTLTKRLAKELFTSLAERLNGREGKEVMAWKGEAEARALARGQRTMTDDEVAVDMRDLEPTCAFSAGKARKYGRKVSASSSAATAEAERAMMEEQSREIEQTCRISHESLLPYFGIGFELSLTLRETPMAGLTSDQIRVKLTLDDKRQTQPVRDAEVTIRATVQSPNHGDGGVGLGNAPPEMMEEARRRRARASNADRAVDRLVARADAVLNVMDNGARTMEKDNLGSRTVTVRPMPVHPSLLGGEDGGGGNDAARPAAGEQEEEIPANVQQLCKEHGMDMANCRRAWELMQEDMRKEQEEEAEAAAESEEAAAASAEAEAEPVEEEERRRRRGELPTQTDEEIEAEMDAWMKEEEERWSIEEYEAERAEAERLEQEQFEERERELNELMERREEESNREAEEMLQKIEEMERRAAAVKAGAADGSGSGSGSGGTCGDGALECPGDSIDGEDTPLPSPTLDQSRAPEAGPVDAARDEL